VDTHLGFSASSPTAAAVVAWRRSAARWPPRRRAATTPAKAPALRQCRSPYTVRAAGKGACALSPPAATPSHARPSGPVRL